jgi:prevent-host-death family protein
MSTRNIDINDVKDNFQDLVLQAEQGDEIIITKENKPIAKLISLHEEEERMPGLNKGEIWMSDDFDKPLSEDYWMGKE